MDASSYVYSSEIFPTSIRAQGAGFSVSGLFCFSLIYTMCAPVAFNNIGLVLSYQEFSCFEPPTYVNNATDRKY